MGAASSSGTDISISWFCPTCKMVKTGYDTVEAAQLGLRIHQKKAHGESTKEGTWREIREGLLEFSRGGIVERRREGWMAYPNVEITDSETAEKMVSPFPSMEAAQKFVEQTAHGSARVTLSL
jgi:hypothetical protein